jgi:hypothetical protein
MDKLQRNSFLSILPFVEILQWPSMASTCKRFSEIIRSIPPGSPYYQRQLDDQTKKDQWVKAFLYRPSLDANLIFGQLQVDSKYENPIQYKPLTFLFKTKDRLFQAKQQNVCRLWRYKNDHSDEICCICECWCTIKTKCGLQYDRLSNVTRLSVDATNPLIDYLLQEEEEEEATELALCDRCSQQFLQFDAFPPDRAFIKGVWCQWDSAYRMND